MKADQDPESRRLDALIRLLDAAERFVNRAPRQRRIEPERQALLDAITHAQLVASVDRHAESGRAAGPLRVLSGTGVVRSTRTRRNREGDRRKREQLRGDKSQR